MPLLLLILVSPVAPLLNLPATHLARVKGEGKECWGYEPNCTLVPTVACSDKGEVAWKGWATSRQDAESLFNKQADFGFLRARLSEVETLCEGGGRSSLQCSKDLLFCTGQNIRLDFRHLEERVRTENLRYQMDIFRPGDLSVSCRLDKVRLEEQLELLSPLQSWAPELRHLREGEEECDLTITQPTYIVKLDATMNMYHHFCDFFNLYLSVHLNQSLGEDKSSWDNRDKQVLVLDNNRYLSSFAPVWDAFTTQPLLNLGDVVGKAVCFKQAVFPLLPRQLFGLFYNTPLVPECRGSAMFLAFSQFVLHRLSIPLQAPLPHRLRVTLLSRDTAYRRIINEEELVIALQDTGLYEVRVARFSPSFPFTSQLAVVASTDILVGMHGAGLTHLLFLPKWGQLVELYNCGDRDCYRDLARLRGVGYVTWKQEELVTRVDAGLGGPYEKGPAHLKFSNYKFDPGELVRLVGEARVNVLDSPEFVKSRVTGKKQEL